MVDLSSSIRKKSWPGTAIFKDLLHINLLRDKVAFVETFVVLDLHTKLSLHCNFLLMVYTFFCCMFVISHIQDLVFFLVEKISEKKCFFTNPKGSICAMLLYLR